MLKFLLVLLLSILPVIANGAMSAWGDDAVSSSALTSEDLESYRDAIEPDTTGHWIPIIDSIVKNITYISHIKGLGSDFVDYHEPKPYFLKMKINLKIDTVGWDSYKSTRDKMNPICENIDSSWYHNPILKYTEDTTYYLPLDVLFLIKHYYCDSTFNAEWMKRWMLSKDGE